MQSQRIKQTVLAVALIACGYVLGASTPSATAYTGNETQLQNRIVSELAGIRKALDVIAQKMPK